MSMSKKSESEDHEKHEAATTVERWNARVARKRANKEKEASTSSVNAVPADQLPDSRIVEEHSNRESKAGQSTTSAPAGEKPQDPTPLQNSEAGKSTRHSDDQEAAEQQKPETSDKDFYLPTYATLTSLETVPKSIPGRRSELISKVEVPDLSGPVIPGVAERMVPGPPRPVRSGYRSSIVIGFLLLLGFGGFGVWSVLAPLRSGAMAPGVVKLAGERKTIQHLEGGIIQAILVREGDVVEAGQVLVRLDGNKANASLAAMIAEYHALLAREARLQSERHSLEAVRIPEKLSAASDDPNAKELIEGEQNLFSARRASINDQLNVFYSWQRTYEQEISGLVAQRSAAKKQLVHIDDELAAVETLYKKGLIDKPRLLELKRTAAGLNGRVGAFAADIARAKQKIGEAKLRAISLQTQQQQEEVSAELQKVQTSIVTFEERLQAARDIVKRLNITAPRSGRVVGLRFHTPGGVIIPSTSILDIVPEDDKLIVEARVTPIDIDIVVPGMEARIQLTAYSMRKTSPLPGKVLQVSADRIEDPRTGEPFYLAKVEIDPAALQELEGAKLYPGMPASVQIVSGERTALDYLLAPIQAGLRETWLE